MEKQKEQVPLLGRAQVIRLSRLLYMKYRPSEIADIIDVNVETVRRSYLAAGCPHERDTSRHIWIVGTEFKAWAEDVIAKRKRKTPNPMDENEAWCMKCNDRVEIINPTVKPVSYYLEILQSICPRCGTKVNRARARVDE